MPDDVIGDVIDDIIGGVSSESVDDSYGVMPSVNKLVCLRLVMVVFVWACFCYGLEYYHVRGMWVTCHVTLGGGVDHVTWAVID